MSTLASRILALAIAIMPPGRRDWAKAMAAEFQHIDIGQMGFAFGCFRSAIMANFTHQTRIFQIGLGLLALSLLSLAGFGLWFALANFNAYPGHSFNFAMGNLFLVVLCLIGAIGAVLAARQGSNPHAMAKICARTIAWVTLATGTGWFLTLGLVNLWQDGAHSPMLAPVLLVAALFATVGWLGRHSPSRLRDAGLAGMAIGLVFLVTSSLLATDTSNWDGFGMMTLVLMAVVAASGAMLQWAGQSHESQAT